MSVFFKFAFILLPLEVVYSSYYFYLCLPSYSFILAMGRLWVRIQVQSLVLRYTCQNVYVQDTEPQADPGVCVSVYSLLVSPFI